jgi:hypothetical protein
VFDNRLVVPEAVISGGIVNVGNVYKSVVDADALSSTAVVDGGHMSGIGISSNVTTVFGGRVEVSVAGVPVVAFEAATLSGLKEPVDIGAMGSFTASGWSGLNAGAFEILADALGLEPFIDIGAVGVTSTFGIKEFRTDCAVCMIFFSMKSSEIVGYSR